MPHGITQCYSASEVTTLWRYTNLFIIIIIITCHPAEVTGALNPAEAGTRFSDPGGMQG